jgi:CheY-like chemotaxis protein
LEDVLTKVADMVSMKADEKGLELVFNSENDTPEELVGDPLRLGQVLINLTSNAIKFTETGEVVIHSRLVEDRGDRVVLRFDVCDTGIGLSEGQTKRLFQAFSQADTSTTRKFGGTGLGLVICQRIVNMMEGNIELQSEPGKGSTFSYTAVFGRHDKKRALPLMVAEDFKDMRALVVDDSRTARQTLKHILESIHVKVTVAGSGQEALQILEKCAAEENCFDMVFTDFKMPLMNGLETAKHIKRNRRLARLPVIVMVTAYGREELLQQAEQIGLDGFLTKPVSPSTILDSIITAFGKKPDIQQEGRAEPLKIKGGLGRIAGARILLAEDNDINQQVARELMTSVGLDVAVANNGKAALEMLQNAHFDAILMDVQMPVMYGLEATRRIRKLEQQSQNNNQKSTIKNFQIPIIALTAHAMSGDRERSLQAGMNDHITKPLDPEELFATLVKWIKFVKRPVIKTPPVKGQEKVKLAREMPLPELPGIDVASVLTRVGGNQASLIRLLKKFNNFP